MTFVPTSMCFLWGGFTGLASGTDGRGRRSIPQGAIGKYTFIPVLVGGGCGKSSGQAPSQDPQAESGTGSGLRCGLRG